MRGKCTLCGRTQRVETTEEIASRGLPKDVEDFLLAVARATQVCTMCVLKNASIALEQIRLDYVNGRLPPEALKRSADEAAR